MHVRRILLGASALSTLAFGSGAGATTARVTGVPPASAAAATAAATWLAGRFGPTGFIPQSGHPTATFSTTANAVLALASADTALPVAEVGFTYLATHIDTYVVVTAVDVPSKLALLMLDAEALGQNPATVGGSDLVSRLLATEQATGPQAGLFGTTTQLQAFFVGHYSQGLALAALAGAGVEGTPTVTAAVTWLLSGQCGDGGWGYSLFTCTGTAETFDAPDTNSTALAIEGLAAQGALTPTVKGTAVGFLASVELTDGGWSSYPQTPTAPQSTDPDSTAVVVQALIAAGLDPAGPTFTKGSESPLARIASFQVSAGPTAGGLAFVATTTSATPLATYEAVPALAGAAIPFGAAADLTAAAAYLVSPANLTDGTHYGVEFTTVTYLTVGGTIDAALALAASRHDPGELAMLTTWVGRQAATYTGVATTTLYGGAVGKLALLAEVVGDDPATFGGQDLIAELDEAVCTTLSTRCTAVGNYTTTYSPFSLALGVMAQLRDADTSGATGPVAYLESLQHQDGSWTGAFTGTTGTVDTTALAVMALALTSSGTAQSAVAAGQAWLVTQQQDDGGFAGASGTSVNSTALAVMALGLSPTDAVPVTAGQAFLATEQNADGGFSLAAGATTGSAVRATTQAVNGAVGTSLGTLSDPLTGPTPPAPPAGTTTANGASSQTAAGSATASLPGAGITATGTGIGALTVATYAANPTTGSVSGGTGLYYDVAVAPQSEFSSLALTVCTLGSGGQSLTWWNGTAWAPFSEQRAANGCVTATVSADTMPTLAQLTGTPVAPSTDLIASPANGYWEVAADGGIFAFTAPFHGSMGGRPLQAPIVGIAATPDGNGYWEVAADGGIFAFTAPFHGSMGGQPLNAPIVGMAVDPSTGGYWEVAADGGIFAFTAPFHGSMGGQPLNAPIVGLAAYPTGDGYWEVAADGGIFSFGPSGGARFYGSMGGQALNAPIVGIAAAPTGAGYWEVAADGGIFSFGPSGAVPFYGSEGGKPLQAPIVGITASPTGLGYWEVAADGGIFGFGDATFHGSMGGQPLAAPVHGVAAR